MKILKKGKTEYKFKCYFCGCVFKADLENECNISYDNKCTNKNIAQGDDLLPKTSYGDVYLPDEVYEHVRQLWIEGKPGE